MYSVKSISLGQSFLPSSHLLSLFGVELHGRVADEHLKHPLQHEERADEELTLLHRLRQGAVLQAHPDLRGGGGGDGDVMIRAMVNVNMKRNMEGLPALSNK